MITYHSDGFLEVTAHDRKSLENDLNTAEAVAQNHAMQERDHGILVTRYNPTTYTVALSREVPFGQTHEHQQASDLS